jgi:hypothetical protein
VKAMHFKDTRVAGAWIIDISPHHDDRGRFLRAWCVREFEEQSIHFLPVQANMQFSPRKETASADTACAGGKPVRSTRGAIFDVASETCPALFRGRAKRGARDLCTPQWFRGDGIRPALRPVPEWRADFISFMESVG